MPPPAPAPPAPVAAAEAPPVKVEKPEAPTPTPAPPAAGAPYLGIELEDDGSLRVKSVAANGPAAKAQVTAGLTILKLDDRTLTRWQDLPDALSKHSPGDEVTLTLATSDGFERRVTVVVGTRPAASAPARPKAGKRPYMGFTLARVVDGGRNWLRVDEVRAGSPAATARIAPGDYLLAIDGKKVDDLDGVLAAIRPRAPGDAIRLQLLRAGREMEIVLTLGEAP